MLQEELIMNDIRISLIVPVYNGEAFIDRCLDSLVYQSFSGFEILVIDNGSTDDTLRIIEEYADRFSNLYVYHINHTDGPGGGRNEGLKHAKGEYIAFADADDYYDYNAIEIINDYLKNNLCDIVCYPCYEVRGTKVTINRRSLNPTIEYYLKDGSMVFWNKVIKKELFVECGMIPEDFVFEDLAYVPVLISHAKIIQYIDIPLYYYIIREDSSVNTLKSVRNLDSIKACKYALENIPEKYKDIFMGSVAKRITDDIRNRWPFADEYICYLLELKEQLLVNKNVTSDAFFSRLQPFLRMDNPFPYNIVINDFYNDIDEIKEKEYRNEVYFEGSKTSIFKMNANTCDISINEFTKKAYANKHFEELGHYFAIKYIYENGGIYLDKEVCINSYFNCLRYLECFLGYTDKINFTDQVFGGKKGNRFLYKILKTYEDNYYLDEYFPLADRFKNILVLDYKQILTGKIFYHNDFTLLSYNMLCYDLGDQKNICAISPKKYKNTQELVLINKNILQDLQKNADTAKPPKGETPINSKKNQLEQMAKSIILKKNIFYDGNKPIPKLKRKRSIPIVVSSSDYFVPYLSVLLESISVNAKSEDYYDVIVLNKDISFFNMLLLVKQVSKKNNFSIRFYNTQKYIDKTVFRVREHFTVETYFRMFVPYVLIEYDKALYLDSDMVVNTDVAQLYKVDLQDKILGITNDAIMVASYHFEGSNQNKFLKQLNINNPDLYFQAGTCLINLKGYREYIDEQVLISIISAGTWMYGDQDVLNLLFQGKVYYFDMSWNYTVDVISGRRTRLIDGYAPQNIKEAYHTAKKSPKIIHYAGPQKPWNTYEAEYMQNFWMYAKNSVFYNLLIERLYKSDGKDVENTAGYDQNSILQILQEQNKTDALKDKVRRYKIEIDRLLKCQAKLEQEKQELLMGINNYETSFFWKLTSPMRKVLDLIRKENTDNM